MYHNKTLPTIIELLQILEKDHEEDKYLYRGQTKRYEPHRWVVNHENREVEALYPGDFRFHYKNVDFSPQYHEQRIRQATAARAYGRNIRDQFITFLTITLLADDQNGAWLMEKYPEMIKSMKDKKPPQDSHFYRVAWSFAQHYVVATALTDLTFSLRVAAWFATEPWDPNGKRPKAGGRGVIYRIHRTKLESILKNANYIFQINSMIMPELFLVDIRDIPSSFARRPSAQQGASLYGFDQPIVIAAAFKGGAIEAFDFEQQPGLNIGISREEVVPNDDPFLSKLENFKAFRDIIRPLNIDSEPKENNANELLEKANSVLHLGLISAHEVDKIRLTEQTMATIFDQITRHGQIEFRYLMIVENEPLKAVVCGITAEPMNLVGGLSPTMLKAVGFGDQALRLWIPDNSGMTVKIGHWEEVKEFIDSASKAVREAKIG